MASKLAGLQSNAPERQARWETDLRESLDSKTNVWNLLDPQEVLSESRSPITRQEDGSWLVGGEGVANDTYTITAKLDNPQITGFLLESLPDASLPNQSLGRAPNGNFVLSDVEIELQGEGAAEPIAGEFIKAEASYEQKGWPISSVIADKPKKGRKKAKGNGWAVDGNTRREPARAMFVLSQPLAQQGPATVTIRLIHNSLNNHQIGRFRISLTSLASSAIRLDDERLPGNLRDILLRPVAERTPEQAKQLAEHFTKREDTELLAADKAVKDAAKAYDDFEDSIPSVMVMKERAQPRDAFVLTRGEYDRPADKVSRGLPAALPGPPADTSLDRLAFARWLVSREQPLTARVWVNRYWERLFGVGLVKTSENFGSQAEWPTHPELLDWLAVEFMQPTRLPEVSGQPAKPWDVKALLKFLVMSDTYQQSSQVTPELLQQDPENRWYARGARFRLSAEVTRDQALAVSGLLVPKLGGPSVRPYMPEGVWDETSRYGDLRGYKSDQGEGLYRRSLYTIWKRTAAPPSMLLFDAPNREVCTVKRSRTNTPLQALALLNEVTYVEAAKKLAERMVREGGSSTEERFAIRFSTCDLPSTIRRRTGCIAARDFR